MPGGAGGGGGGERGDGTGRAAAERDEAIPDARTRLFTALAEEALRAPAGDRPLARPPRAEVSPPPGTKRTRLVQTHVLNGHAVSTLQLLAGDELTGLPPLIGVTPGVPASKVLHPCACSCKAATKAFVGVALSSFAVVSARALGCCQ